MQAENQFGVLRPAPLVRAAHSQVLWAKIALASPLLATASVRFWTNAGLAERLPRFLLELHSIVRGGLAVMEMARARAEELAPDDAVAASLAPYLSRHIEEERHHDEWLLDDMEFCGIDRQQALSRTPSGAVAALLGAQAYWVLQEHPVALLGYIAVVEGNPPSIEHLEEIRRSTGFPAEVFRCLREHAQVDVHHQQELRDAIDALPLQPGHRQLLALSAFETIEGLSRIFELLSAERPASVGGRA